MVMGNGRGLVLTACIILAFATLAVFANLNKPLILNPGFGVLMLVGTILGFVGFGKIPKPTKPAASTSSSPSP
jgi:uncharacterized membrane protein YGL010W